MDMDLLLMLAFTIASLFIIVGGIVLYPIARRLGAYLEALALARRGGRGPALQDAAGLRDLLSEVSRSLEAIEGRLDLIDDRQTFLERLVEARTPDRLVEGPASRAPDAGTPTA